MLRTHQQISGFVMEILLQYFLIFFVGEVKKACADGCDSFDYFCTPLPFFAKLGIARPIPKVQSIAVRALSLPSSFSLPEHPLAGKERIPQYRWYCSVPLKWSCWYNIPTSPALGVSEFCWNSQNATIPSVYWYWYWYCSKCTCIMH